MQTKIFKTPVKGNNWMPMINLLEHKGWDVYPTNEECDKAIMLSGRHENPTVFECERVLIYHKIEWMNQWDFFKPILEEYYDEMIDVTDVSLLKASEIVIHAAN